MIFEKLSEIAKNSKSTIAIGVGDQEEYLHRTVQAAQKAAQRGVAKIIVLGNIEKIPKKYPKKETIQIQSSLTPEETILKMLSSNEVDAVVRGSLPATSFLKNVKAQFNVKNLRRIALLESANGHQFFFAPVGIDEARTIPEKINFVQEGVSLIQKIGITPKVAILSGGRAGDIGRDPIVDQTIKEAEEAVQEIKKRNITQNIENYQILIEDAIKNQANLILAPDGISGNLIYRTLIHLGKGKSYGAPYTNIPKTIIDTSRVGPINEYLGAIILASALATKKIK
ncbi:MAG: methanogenesis marker protein Mmp4/MtxX [Candidatus Freyarchaeota archaeon]|nr:methanogenesis marker protein Mmp4/MtxX [Candidatus Jordarchaeia archaeon]MBS7268257.1 methanogenesis marker protein Mmp4/MtxX [Candidatus Jordarchaeia archaeon]MBS7279542.1 methanogenesis marker protein Mmp4/MtxX [Candidatus Jordarchaeia archaeon]